MRYIAKLPVFQGEFINSEDQALYEQLKLTAKSQPVTSKFVPLYNSYYPNGYVCVTKSVIRKRYNGPRRSGRVGQSMCLKRDATEARLYIQRESKYVAL